MEGGPITGGRSVGRRWVYIFNRRKAKKEIPVQPWSVESLLERVWATDTGQG